MQISISIDSDRHKMVKNPHPHPPILGDIGYLHYNKFSVLTNFVLTGFRCMYEVIDFFFFFGSYIGLV